MAGSWEPSKGLLLKTLGVVRASQWSNSANQKAFQEVSMSEITCMSEVISAVCSQTNHTMTLNFIMKLSTLTCYQLKPTA